MTDPGSSPPGEDALPGIDTTVVSPARIYDYWLGGKDNYPVDRAAGEQVIEVFPGMLPGVRANRALLGRMVRYLAGEAGVRQFLDIGTGLPTRDNTHEVAQAVAPESRVVYVDNDPIVLVHARALLKSSPQGVTKFVQADLRDPDKILQAASKTLDFSQPVAVMLLMILMLIEDHEDPYGIVDRLMAALPSGSYLAISHPVGGVGSGELAEAYERLKKLMPDRPTLRSKDQIAQFFHGLNMVEPGVVQLHRWRPDPADAESVLHYDVPAYAGVGQKP
jgi:S-adenosyl methyltransferase